MATAARIRHCERMMSTATSVPERETYRAELRRLRGESETQPCAALVIPPDMVEPLRDGVYLALDAAIEQLARAKFPAGHKADPDRYELLEATQALLDRTGRVPASPPVSISVDLDRHRLILLDALNPKARRRDTGAAPVRPARRRPRGREHRTPGRVHRHGRRARRCPPSRPLSAG
jgi:hypothetical protein